MHGINSRDGTVGGPEHAGLQVHFKGADFEVANMPQEKEGMQGERISGQVENPVKGGGLQPPKTPWR